MEKKRKSGEFGNKLWQSYDEIETSFIKILKATWENIKNEIKEELDMSLNLSSITSNFMEKKKLFQY